MQKVRYAKIQVTGYVTFRYSTSSLNRDVEIYETYIIHIIQVITPFSIVTVCIVIFSYRNDILKHFLYGYNYRIRNLGRNERKIYPCSSLYLYMHTSNAKEQYSILLRDKQLL